MLKYSRLRSLSVRVCVDFSYFLTIIIFKNIWFNRRENYLSSQKIKRLVVLFAVSWEVSPQGIQKQFAGSRYCWEALLFLFSYSLLLYSTGRRQIQEKEVTIPWSNESSQITREQIWDQINATPRAWIKKDQKYTCIRFNPLKQITLLKKKLADENPPKRLKPLPSHTSQNLPFVLCSTRCYDWFSGNAQTFLWFWSIHHHHPRFPPCCNTDVKIVYKFDESIWSHSKDKQLTKII